jgi:hypothetical protein
LVNYTNLGESEDNIYMQLKRYKKKFQWLFGYINFSCTLDGTWFWLLLLHNRI